MTERKNGLIVAIDGPSGAGKSTLTTLLADRLGYIHIDTGAMYRTVALAVTRQGVSPDDEAALSQLLAGTKIEFLRDNGCCRVLANGVDVSEAIRTPEISLLTSRVSSKPIVREAMGKLQRQLGRHGGVILEGRDIGTVVFPDAEVKFFLTASPEERGHRRFLELTAKGIPVTLEQTVAEVVQRDRQDSEREHAPLKRAKDAIDIDSTGLTIDQVLDQMEQVVRNRQPRGDA
ncbi:MAG TPA: (d)CMP kinase [Geobacterales bacterium]|nr:(d)CMP kinase [Geobacterales bacterium]